MAAPREAIVALLLLYAGIPAACSPAKQHAVFAFPVPLLRSPC